MSSGLIARSSSETAIRSGTRIPIAIRKIDATKASDCNRKNRTQPCIWRVASSPNALSKKTPAASPFNDVSIGATLLHSKISAIQ